MTSIIGKGIPPFLELNKFIAILRFKQNHLFSGIL